MVKIKKHRVILSIILGAIIVRMLVVIFMPHLGQGEMLDSTRYQRVAANILRGRGFAEYIRPTAFAPPVYPYFLAGIYKGFGYSVFTVKTIQAFLGALTCFFIYIISRLFFNYKVGIVVAVLAAFYPELVILSGYLYTETLYIFILYLALALFMRGLVKTQGYLLWIMAGCFLGLSILTRHVLLLFPIVGFFILLLTKKTRKHLCKFAVFTLVCYLVITPWIIRNYRCFGKFVPVASGVGGVVWIGSHLEDQGEYHYAKSREKAWKEAGTRDLVEMDDILWKKALLNIVRHPFDYGSIMMKKVYNFFFQIYEHVPATEKTEQKTYVKLLLVFSYVPILIFSFYGIFVTRSRWRDFMMIYGLIIYTVSVYAFTVVVPRYRIPLLPLLFIFTAAGFWSIWDRMVSKNKRSEPH